MRKLFVLLLVVLLLYGCSAAPPETQPPEITAVQLTEPPTIVPPETTESKQAWETMQTPESTCFTVISYCAATRELQVQFRESRIWYSYFDFEPGMWSDFKNADSKGGFFNDYIKGSYEYKRLN